jgi:stage II sporulation protein D (peptidoglycan lytic transglycosylase)
MKIRYVQIFVLTLMIIIMSCAGSKRFTDEYSSASNRSSDIRLLLDAHRSNINFYLSEPVDLYEDGNEIAVVNSGNHLQFLGDGRTLVLSIQNKIFTGDYFEIKPHNNSDYISFKGKNFRGRIKFYIRGDSIRSINILPLEEYLKGVVPAEMPVKNGNNYFEALKAFAICARTYSIMKINLNNSNYDVYLDVRDQVYGGADYENPVSNKAIEETRGFILTYHSTPAVIYYSSTCGGHTENSANVFTSQEYPYLSGIVDGDPSYCSISPKFEWEEDFTDSEIIHRLISAGYINNDNSILHSITIISRFNSGRVNNLQITYENPGGPLENVNFYGNKIRSILRTADNKNILESTLFNIEYDKENHVVKIRGKGFGHGVGFCQWGSIKMAELGFDYKKILFHYFPGTSISNYYDNF